MKEETKFIEICSAINPKNGEVTLFLGNERWGPVVTGKNLAEAKARMKEAFGLSMIANSFLDPLNFDGHTPDTNPGVEMNRLENTLQYSL